MDFQTFNWQMFDGDGLRVDHAFRVTHIVHPCTTVRTEDCVDPHMAAVAHLYPLLNERCLTLAIVEGD